MSTQLVTIDLVHDGAVLAESVVDGQGNLLLPAGSALALTTLGNLRRRGIETLTIFTSEPEPSLALEDQSLRSENVTKHMRNVFRHSLAEGRVNPLFHIVLNYRQNSPA